MSNSILISVGAVIACALVAISKKDRKKMNFKSNGKFYR